jgi:hypothetical protein
MNAKPIFHQLSLARGGNQPRALESYLRHGDVTPVIAERSVPKRLGYGVISKTTPRLCVPPSVVVP